MAAKEEKPVKDVFSINELDAVNTVLSDFNDFLMNHDGWDDVKVTTAVLTLKDKNNVLIGSLTKYGEHEDVKFEPNFDFQGAVFGE